MTEKDQSVNNEEVAENQENTAKDSNADEQNETVNQEEVLEEQKLLKMTVKMKKFNN